MGDHDTTEFDITECAVTNFQEFGITESEITVKGTAIMKSDITETVIT